MTSCRTTATISPLSTAIEIMETAGRDILLNYCDNFPTSQNNHILPHVVESKHPEPRDPTTGSFTPHSRGLTRKETNQLHGDEINQGGEMAEYEVYKTFHKLACKSNAYPFLVLHGMNLSLMMPMLFGLLMLYWML